MKAQTSTLLFLYVFFAYISMNLITLFQDVDLRFRISWKGIHWK